MTNSRRTKAILDLAIKMATKRNSPDIIFVAHETVRNFLAAQAPSLHMLYSAAWAAGYTVNGIAPPKAAPRQ